MKAAAICAASGAQKAQLKEILNRIYKALSELDVTVLEANLDDYTLPFFNGDDGAYEDVTGIMEGIGRSDVVLFACNAGLYTPCAQMATFMEYFNHPAFNTLLNNRQCMNIVYAQHNGEREAAECMAKMIAVFGGNEAVRIALCSRSFEELQNEGENKDIIGKYVEDFYRITRQNRPTLYASEYYLYQQQVQTQQVLASNAAQQPKGSVVNPIKMPLVIDNQKNAIQFKTMDQNNTTPSFTGSQAQGLSALHQPSHVSQEKLDWDMATNFVPHTEQEILTKGKLLDTTSDDADKDIEELAMIFSQKLQEHSDLLASEPKESSKSGSNLNFKPSAPVYARPTLKQGISAPPVRTKSVRQMTQNLPHYFQPQLSGDTNAVIQLNVSGKENFECYLRIQDAECYFKDGVAQESDLTILVSASVWEDVLKGKFTAQKAFMMGQIKVRGNFMLLNKFDQVFKTV